MRVKLQNKLQPSEHSAHSVVIEDSLGNPVFVALQLSESIVFAGVNDPDFHSLLRAAGIDKVVAVTELKPKPHENLLWTP